MFEGWRPIEVLLIIWAVVAWFGILYFLIENLPVLFQ